MFRSMEREQTAWRQDDLSAVQESVDSVEQRSRRSAEKLLRPQLLTDHRSRRFFYLANSANLPTGLYFACINFFFFNGEIISGSTGPIFVILAPNDRYLFEYDRSGLFF